MPGMLNRLAGIETEYALRFRPADSQGRVVGNLQLFKRLAAQVKKRVPLVRSIYRDVELAYFTGNGGVVRFERLPFLAWLPSAGLVEGATPECRGPRQLLRYQRAQDVLLSRAAVACGGRLGAVSLLKNNRDSRGSLYGSHENYEATIATGPALFCWRLGVAVLLPLSLPLVLIAEILCWLLLMVLSPAALMLPGRKRNPPVMVERVVRIALGIIAFPALIGVDMLVRLTAFRRTRRELLAFLVTRPIIAGTGMVDEHGRFHLSPRVRALGAVCSTVTHTGRAVFYFGHVWKGLIALLCGDRHGYARLFRERQRLQIGVGDSNMAQVAEYLKFGTTLLVLDAIEAGVLREAPSLRSPLPAFRTICADPTLRATVKVAGGPARTALDIQRVYLDACRRYVNQAAPEHGEAAEILDLWQDTLDRLERDPHELIGKLDWVTKRHLLETAGAGLSLEARRKIDLRYHELSQQGYYLQMEAAGIAPTVIEPEEVLGAIEMAPAGTPASERGRLIRQFARLKKHVSAGWSSVVIGSGPNARVVRLDP